MLAKIFLGQFWSFFVIFRGHVVQKSHFWSKFPNFVKKVFPQKSRKSDFWRKKKIQCKFFFWWHLENFSKISTKFYLKNRKNWLLTRKMTLQFFSIFFFFFFLFLCLFIFYSVFNFFFRIMRGTIVLGIFIVVFHCGGTTKCRWTTKCRCIHMTDPYKINVLLCKINMYFTKGIYQICVLKQIISTHTWFSNFKFANRNYLMFRILYFLHISIPNFANIL